MNLLFITSRLPYPPLQGDRLRAFHQLRLLSRRHRLTLLAPIFRPAERAQAASLAAFCEQIELVPASPWRGAWRAAWGTPSGLPWQTLYFCEPGLITRARELLRRLPIDLVHVQLIRSAPVVAALGGWPRVLDLIDALSLNMDRQAGRERAPMSWLWRAEAGRLLRYEQAMMRQFTRLTISTEQDRSVIGDYANLRVVPQAVDGAQFPFMTEGREPALLVFSGRLGYFPNADAALYLVRDILPLIRRQLPQVRVELVGADPPLRVRRLARVPGVTVTGYVDNPHAYLARATVAVVPMRAGSGMQNKVLEAMSSGVPVVATPYALGGLAVRDGEHLRIGCDAPQLAECVLELLRDVAQRERLARNARQLVEANYGWDTAVAALEQVYIEAIAAGRSGIA